MPCEFLSLKELVGFLSSDFFQRPYAQKCSTQTAVDRLELPSGKQHAHLMPSDFVAQLDMEHMRIS